VSGKCLAQCQAHDSLDLYHRVKLICFHAGVTISRIQREIDLFSTNGPSRTAAVHFVLGVSGLKTLPSAEHFLIANAKNLTSILNGTKWDRLLRALEEVRDCLDFRHKDIRDDFWFPKILVGITTFITYSVCLSLLSG